MEKMRQPFVFMLFLGSQGGGRGKVKKKGSSNTTWLSFVHHFSIIYSPRPSKKYTKKMIYLSFFVSLKSIHLLGRLELIISGPILPKLSPASVRLRCIPEVPFAFPRRLPDRTVDDGPPAELPK